MKSAIKLPINELRRNHCRWKDLPLAERLGQFDALVSALERHKQSIIDALSKDCHRSFASKVEFLLFIEKIKYWRKRVGEIGEKEEAGTSAMMPTVNYTTIRQPYALVGCISPWNFPLLLSFIDAIPALMAGCAVIIKPSEITPHFVAPTQTAIDEVPEIAKILKIIAGGPTVGEALVDAVDFICFTGSIATGKKIAVQAAKKLTPICLELGGKDPVIICDDAHIESASRAVIRSSCSVSGQGCQSVERVYVHKKIYDIFLSETIKQARSITSTFDDSEHGVMLPFIFDKQAKVVEMQIADAVAKGAKIELGGGFRKKDNKIWPDITILSNVDHTMKVMTEETFGPVIPIMKYSTTEEAIDLANDSDYGLSGAVLSQSTTKACDIAKKLLVGAVSIGDAALTTFVSEAEKNSFNLSGFGPSRMGDSGYTRFFRKKSILKQTGPIASLAMFSNSNE